VPPCSSASARPHYVAHLLDAETRSVPSFAERNFEHRHRQPKAGRIRSTSGVPAPLRKSQVRHPSSREGRKRASLEGAFLGGARLGKGRVSARPGLGG